MSGRGAGKSQRANDPPPEKKAKAKANGKMDSFVSKASTKEIKAIRESTATIRESTANIENDTKEIKRTVRDLEIKVDSLNSRVEDTEQRIVALEESQDSSDQQLTTLREELQKMQNHLNDLEDRGRRCNIKILGLPESKEGNDMIKFLQQEIPAMLDHAFGTLEMQRAHRVPTGPPRRNPGERPRPVMVNMLRYQDKEAILRIAREKKQVLWHGAKIMFFPDYSRQTTEQRMSFNKVKAELREKGVEYVLRFPAVLEIKHNGFRHRFKSPTEAAEFIAKKFSTDKGHDEQ
ncbi:hypothetical protein WMY93_032982 [Mugilogobius chulae]|uniref:L1 transposable element RRM domain-containing protein n=1 Tax=Mugilogobius chulae TaxID=88201 RepID=A0AAW0MI80_9GOBI